MGPKSHQAIKDALNNQGWSWTLPHQDQFIISARNPKSGHKHFFIRNNSPINSSTAHRIAKDKDLSYTLLKDKPFTLPWIGILDPESEYNLNSDYTYGTAMKNFKSSALSFPLVLKPNMGSLGRNVLLITTLSQLQDGLQRIFRDPKSSEYLAVAQEYVEIDEEYRVITLDGKIKLAYLKDTRGADFTGNLSPLHWEGAKAVNIELDTISVDSPMRQIASEVFIETQIRYSGLDIVKTISGEYKLLEINSHPMFEVYLRDNSTDKLTTVFEDVIKLLP